MKLGKTGIDCENIRDFLQYYPRGTYFGWPHSGVVAPALMSGEREKNSVQIHIYGIGGERLDSPLVPWASLVAGGVFGLPALGNTQIGATYVYIKKAAVRESYKGLRLSGIYGVWPDAEQGARAAVNKLLGLPRASRDYAITFPMAVGKIDSEVIYNIYNPKRNSFRQAVAALESGSAIGVPLSLDVGLYLRRGDTRIRVSFRDVMDVAYLGDDLSLRIEEGRNAMLAPLLEATFNGSNHGEVA